MEPIITYHKAGPGDIPTLVDYRIEFQVAMSGPQPQEAINELKVHLVEYFNRALGNNTFIGYIARCNTIVAGMGGIVIRDHAGGFRNPQGKMGYVMNMYTVPAFRRKGICTAILNLLVNDAHATGITAFELHASKDGEHVYKKHGFKIHDEPTYRRFIITD